MTTQELRTEAAIYAEGTGYTTDDLLTAWNTQVDKENENCQEFFARWLAAHESN
jgi:hypothetical protein